MINITCPRTVQEKNYVESEEEREKYKQDDKATLGEMSQANLGTSYAIFVIVTLCKLEIIFEKFLNCSLKMAKEQGHHT